MSVRRRIADVVANHAEGRSLTRSCHSLDHANLLLELDPDLTIKRLLETFPLSRYRNLDGMLDGLRKAGLPE